MQNLSPITDAIRLNHTPITASSSLMAHVTPSRNLTAYMQQPPLHDSSITASLRLRQSYTNGPPRGPSSWVASDRSNRPTEPSKPPDPQDRPSGKADLVGMHEYASLHLAFPLLRLLDFLCGDSLKRDRISLMGITSKTKYLGGISCWAAWFGRIGLHCLDWCRDVGRLGRFTGRLGRRST